MTLTVEHCGMPGSKKPFFDGALTAQTPTMHSPSDERSGSRAPPGSLNLCSESQVLKCRRCVIIPQDQRLRRTAPNRVLGCSIVSFRASAVQVIKGACILMVFLQSPLSPLDIGQHGHFGCQCRDRCVVTRVFSLWYVCAFRVSVNFSALNTHT